MALSPRSEIFCTQYVITGNARAAALEAGYSPASAASQASRMLKRPWIAARIRALRADIARRHCLDADSLAAKLETVYHRALRDQQYTAAGRAVELQARLAGLIGASHGDAKARRDADSAEEAPGPSPADLSTNVNISPPEPGDIVENQGDGLKIDREAVHIRVDTVENRARSVADRAARDGAAIVPVLPPA